MSRFLLFFFLLGSAPSFGQAPPSFSGDKMVWFGLDFSQAKMIGMQSESPARIKDELFRQWNGVIPDEPDKFELKVFFKKKVVHYDLASAAKQNESVDVNQLMSFEEKEIGSGAIQAIISNYSSSQYPDGLGVVGVVESFNKLTKTATVHIVYFDIATRKVIVTQKLTGGPSGFGMKSYWANAIFEILEKVKKKKW